MLCRRIRIMVSMLAIFAPVGAGAAPLATGEILVAHGNEILRVDPDTGDWSVFSPPSAGTNLIPFFTRSMVIDPTGTIFVTTDDYKLVAIDRETGAQDEVHEIDRLCLQQGCFLIDQGVLDVGSQPAGLALASKRTRTHKPVLYVSSGNGLWEVTRTYTGVVSAEQVDGDGDVNSSALALLENASGVVYVLLSKGLTIDAWDPATGLTHLFADPAGLVASFDYRDGDLFFLTQDFGCSASAAGVWLGDYPAPLTWGGFLRCPNDIAIDPVVPLRLWIAEKLGRLVRVQYDGVDWAQTLVADFEEAAGANSYQVAVAPEWVPEPGAAATASVCMAALAWLGRGRSAARRRRRAC